jgi:type VI secretion system protein ImpH
MTTTAHTTKSAIEFDRLKQRLMDRGWEFDFFQAVWLLERCRADRKPVGYRGPVHEEFVRFRPHVSLGFPPSDVRRIVHRPGQGVDPYYQVDVTFMGLYGVSTPLPLHYAIDVLRSVEPYAPADTAEDDKEDRHRGADAYGDTAPAREFLDIVHHRLVSLFYRSWTKYRYDVLFGLPGQDAITEYLQHLIGHSPKYTEKLLGVSPLRMIRYAGVLTQHPRSGTTLEGLLQDYWTDLPVMVQQFVGRWVPVPDADKNSIGLGNSRLGMDVIVGDQVYDLCGSFNIQVGPLDWQTYTTFLPDGERHAQTRSLVKLYCADPLSFTIEVKLLPGEVPLMRLSGDDSAGRLGFTSWARTGDLGETSVIFDATSVAESARASRQTMNVGSPDREPALV